MPLVLRVCELDGGLKVRTNLATTTWERQICCATFKTGLDFNMPGMHRQYTYLFDEYDESPCTLHITVNDEYSRVLGACRVLFASADHAAHDLYLICETHSKCHALVDRFDIVTPDQRLRQLVTDCLQQAVLECCTFRDLASVWVVSESSNVWKNAEHVSCIHKNFSGFLEPCNRTSEKHLFEVSVKAWMKPLHTEGFTKYVSDKTELGKKILENNTSFLRTSTGPDDVSTRLPQPGAHTTNAQAQSQERLAQAVTEVLRATFPAAAEQPDAPFMALGADSLDLRGVAESLSTVLEGRMEVDVVDLFTYTSLHALQGLVVSKVAVPEPQSKQAGRWANPQAVKGTSAGHSSTSLPQTSAHLQSQEQLALAVVEVVRATFPAAAEQPDEPFMTLGADSLDLRGVAESLSTALEGKVDVDVVDLFTYTSLHALQGLVMSKVV